MKNAFLFPILLGVSLSTAFAQSENKDRWDGANTPSILDESFEYKFDKLPLKGDVGVETGIGWSSSYWPSYKGGIAFRWNHPSPNNFKYKSPSFAQLKSMSIEQINQLSPAEKFDIYI
jgi:hypothetical protein